MGETNKQTIQIVLGWVLVIVVVATVAGFILLDRMFVGETPVTRISDYDEWLVKGGDTWLELSMPKSVHDLCEVHNMNSNKIYARFYIAPDDIDQLGNGYTEIPHRKAPPGWSEMRIFIREESPCSTCDVVQYRLVVNTESGFVQLNPENSQALSGVDNACSPYLVY